MKYSFVDGREDESSPAPASAAVPVAPPASSRGPIARAPIASGPAQPPPLPPFVAPKAHHAAPASARAPIAVKVALPREMKRDVSITNGPSPATHVLLDKSAPSDLAETMNNEAVRALLKATVAAMELHELVDPPESTSTPSRKDNR